MRGPAKSASPPARSLVPKGPAPEASGCTILAFGGAVRWSEAGTTFLSLAKVFSGKLLGLDTMDQLVQNGLQTLSQLAALQGFQIFSEAS